MNAIPIRLELHILGQPFSDYSGLIDPIRIPGRLVRSRHKRSRDLAEAENTARAPGLLTNPQHPE